MDEIRHILKQGDLRELLHRDHFQPKTYASESRIRSRFYALMEKLNERDPSLKISECVAIEDSIGGIQSAHQAGMAMSGDRAFLWPRRAAGRESRTGFIDRTADFVILGCENEASKMKCPTRRKTFQQLVTLPDSREYPWLKRR